LVQGELVRVLVSTTGYTQVRASARWRAFQRVNATLDGAVYLYDAPVRGASTSVTGIASAEWALRPWMRVMLSTTVMQTPFAAFEVQGLGRFLIEWEPGSAGGRP
jgi:Tfp pilus assembly protein PilN